MIKMKKCLLVTVCAVATIGQGAVQAADTRVVLINRTKHTIYNINAAPPKEPLYDKQNLLGNSVMRPGDVRIINFDVADTEGLCNISVRFVAGRDQVWSEGINVCNKKIWEITTDQFSNP